MAPSPSMPIAIASPDNVMRFRDIPISPMTRKVASAAIGNCNATSAADRKWPMKNSRTNKTRMEPCNSAPRTVPSAVMTNSLRS